MTVETLADEAAMSPRNFARTFAAETGVTPAKAIERLRLEAARTAVEDTGAGIDVIGAGNRLRRSRADAPRIRPRLWPPAASPAAFGAIRRRLESPNYAYPWLRARNWVVFPWRIDEEDVSADAGNPGHVGIGTRAQASRMETMWRRRPLS